MCQKHQYINKADGVKLDREHMRTFICTSPIQIKWDDRRQIWSSKDTKYLAGLQIFNLKDANNSLFVGRQICYF